MILFVSVPHPLSLQVALLFSSLGKKLKFLENTDDIVELAWLNLVDPYFPSQIFAISSKMILTHISPLAFSPLFSHPLCTSGTAAIPFRPQ